MKRRLKGGRKETAGERRDGENEEVYLEEKEKSKGISRKE